MGNDGCYQSSVVSLQSSGRPDFADDWRL